MYSSDGSIGSFEYRDESDMIERLRRSVRFVVKTLIGECDETEDRGEFDDDDDDDDDVG